ncbi:MAG TPA: hypothetical protein VM409_05275 [Chloroflexia bacterium]|nr:hypothetical protein [Chloroflexia bacterium]
MSDYIKFLRASRGGITPWEISEACGVPAGDIHYIEVKHRRVGGDDAALGTLARFFNVDVSELTTRREAYRKLLTMFLDQNTNSGSPVVFRLESGEQIEGQVCWYSREAVAVAPVSEEGGQGAPFIVQRCWIADWRQAEDEDTSWKVAAALAGQAG